MDLLSDEGARDAGLPLSALRPVLGPDRSDARRVIRSLVERGDAEWTTDPETGERRLKLAFWTLVSALAKREPPDEPEPDSIEEARERWIELREAVRAARAEEAEERRRVEALWEEPGRPSRRRSPGPHQRRVIAVLVRYAEDPQMGLPAAAVRRIAYEGSVPGEKANVLRAVRSLVRSGTLQRSKDGERLRLVDWRTPLLRRHVPLTVDPPLDDSKAEAVLETFGHG